MGTDGANDPYLVNVDNQTFKDRTHNIYAANSGDGLLRTGLIHAWTKNVLFEDEAQKQVRNIALMPFVHHHVAVMPDVHAGIGATVGSVIPTRGAIIPAAVGVDIGCGMVAIRLPLTLSDLPTDLSQIRADLERAIPHGRTNNGRPGDRGAWGNVPEQVRKQLSGDIPGGLAERYANIQLKHPGVRHNSVDKHLGTLGTGNHFVEVCGDEQQNVWLMLHSGSRGPGNAIGTYFISLAREDMRKWFINLPDKDLAYLPEGTEHFNDYIEAVSWAQDYARVSRNLMAMAAVGQMQHHFPGRIPNIVDLVVDVHHNYVELENHYGTNVYVTRKGAVRARAGDLGIIPGSMGTRSYIVRGLGNPESFDSCSHGAGRAMSRTKARATFTLADHVAATQGVECRKDADVIDETPMAYKPIDDVMEAQKDLVEVVHTLKQVLCVKG